MSELTKEIKNKLKEEGLDWYTTIAHREIFVWVLNEYNSPVKVKLLANDNDKRCLVEYPSGELDDFRWYMVYKNEIDAYIEGQAKSLEDFDNYDTLGCSLKDINKMLMSRKDFALWWKSRYKNRKHEYYLFTSDENSRKECKTVVNNLKDSLNLLMNNIKYTSLSYDYSYKGGVSINHSCIWFEDDVLCYHGFSEKVINKALNKKLRGLK